MSTSVDVDFEWVFSKWNLEIFASQGKPFLVWESFQAIEFISKIALELY